MSTITPDAPKKTNRLGLDLQPYRGSKTTLCAGCGHNAISERIIEAFYEMGIDPKQVIKLSGIGCSSKSPAYFLGAAHGFNTVHGRMPSVGTGAMLANRKLIAIGVSGDGDTGAIGIGQFVHLMRRNLPIVYIIEDNGCYGLTKGQFSPTADLGSKAKNGVANELPPIDTCALAIELGASFVARSFSGDKKQLLSILKASLSHKGTSHDRRPVAVRHLQRSRRIDQELRLRQGSRRSARRGQLRAVLRGHQRRLRRRHDASAVEMHDGSKLYLKKVAEDYDPTDKMTALRLLHETARRGEFATGVLYVEPDKEDFISLLGLVDEPLASLPLERVRPGKAVLDEVMESLR